MYWILLHSSTKFTLLSFLWSGFPLTTENVWGIWSILCFFCGGTGPCFYSIFAQIQLIKYHYKKKKSFLFLVFLWECRLFEEGEHELALLKSQGFSNYPEHKRQNVDIVHLLIHLVIKYLLSVFHVPAQPIQQVGEDILDHIPIWILIQQFPEVYTYAHTG